MFKIYILSNGRVLKEVTKYILKHFGLIEEFHIPSEKLDKFLEALEDTYNANPYHNSLHAGKRYFVHLWVFIANRITPAEVTQATGWFVKSCGGLEAFSPCEILALILAAAAHDAGHTGLTNSFLQKTIIGIDEKFDKACVGEQHSLRTLLGILDDADSNILENTDVASVDEIHRHVESIIYATGKQDQTQSMYEVHTDSNLPKIWHSIYNTCKHLRRKLKCMVATSEFGLKRQREWP